MFVHEHSKKQVMKGRYRSLFNGQIKIWDINGGNQSNKTFDAGGNVLVMLFICEIKERFFLFLFPLLFFFLLCASSNVIIYFCF